jgi:hypothetical protein
MGFGSYDESEQEQPDEDDAVDGEDVTAEIRGTSYEGSDSVADGSTDDMMGHL